MSTPDPKDLAGYLAGVAANLEKTAAAIRALTPPKEAPH